jgi:hypothetical protein
MPAQRPATVSLERRAVHDRERARLEFGQVLEGPRHGVSGRGGAQHVLGVQRRLDQAAGGHRRPRTELGEEVAA